MANEMEIVYVDPGYGKLVAYPRESVYTGRLTWVKNKAFNPTSDVAFTHDSNDNNAGTRPTFALLPDGVLDFDQPALATVVAGEYVKKVYSLKCLAYFASGTPTLEIGFSQSFANAHVLGVSFSPSNGDNISCNLKAFGKTESINGSAPNNLYDISMTYSYTFDDRSSQRKYIRSSSVTVAGFAKGNVTVTDEQESTTLPTYQAPRCCVLYRGIGAPHPYVSNVLVGQAYYKGDGDDLLKYEGIPVGTRIYRLTTSATKTNFSSRAIETEVASIFGGETTKENNTEYYTNNNGATLLQQIASFGNTPANHIVVYGNPGYREGGVVTKATGMESDRGLFGTHTLSPEQGSHICAWKRDDFFESLDDLYGNYVGWKAGE